MTPLYLDLSKPALAEVSAAMEYVRATGGDAEAFAARVAQLFREAAASLAEEVADNDTGKPFDQPDAAASIRYSQPVYRLRIETATKRKRGSSAGLWFAYYALRAKSATDKPDTLYIHAFRHSAGRPFNADGDTGQDGE